jgi:hypothetical protein
MNVIQTVPRLTPWAAFFRRSAAGDDGPSARLDRGGCFRRELTSGAEALLFLRRLSGTSGTCAIPISYPSFTFFLRDLLFQDAVFLAFGLPFLGGLEEGLDQRMRVLFC